MKKWLASNSAMGSFTDFNVWDRELSEEEMVEFTRCGSLMRGSLIPWNSSDWMFTPDIAPEEYRMETVEIRSMCSSKVSE